MGRCSGNGLNRRGRPMGLRTEPRSFRSRSRGHHFQRRRGADPDSLPGTVQRYRRRRRDRRGDRRVDESWRCRRRAFRGFHKDPLREDGHGSPRARARFTGLHLEDGSAGRNSRRERLAASAARARRFDLQENGHRRIVAGKGVAGNPGVRGGVRRIRTGETLFQLISAMLDSTSSVRTALRSVRGLIGANSAAPDRIGRDPCHRSEN